MSVPQIVLDDPRSGGERIYASPLEVVRADTIGQVDAAFAKLEVSVPSTDPYAAAAQTAPANGAVAPQTNWLRLGYRSDYPARQREWMLFRDQLQPGQARSLGRKCATGE